jgi:hypothetical protein
MEGFNSSIKGLMIMVHHQSSCFENFNFGVNPMELTARN